jgi:hypothetical protein
MEGLADAAASVEDDEWTWLVGNLKRYATAATIRS